MKSKSLLQTTVSSSTSVTPTRVTREPGTTYDASTTHYNESEAYKSIPMLTINKKRYINITEFARVKGVTEWYARKLCRTGKVEAIKVGRVWFVLKRNK